MLTKDIIIQAVLLLLAMIFWDAGETGLWHKNNMFQRLAKRLKWEWLHWYFDPYNNYYDIPSDLPYPLRDAYHGGKWLTQACIVYAMLVPYHFPFLNMTLYALFFGAIIWICHQIFFNRLFR